MNLISVNVYITNSLSQDKFSLRSVVWNSVQVCPNLAQNRKVLHLKNAVQYSPLPLTWILSQACDSSVKNFKFSWKSDFFFFCGFLQNLFMNWLQKIITNFFKQLWGNIMNFTKDLRNKYQFSSNNCWKKKCNFQQPVAENISN